MRLKIVLNTGETRKKVYEKVKMAENQGLRSGQLFKKMIEQQEKMMAEKNQG